MIKYLLDTNIIIYTIKNRPAHVREVFKRHGDQMAMSTVSLGELVFGAENSSAPEQNLRVVESFAARLEVLPFHDAAAIHFGQIRADLKRAGTPIGPFDQMIAGHARALGLTLVTNNMREFKRVAGLRLENWAR